MKKITEKTLLPWVLLAVLVLAVVVVGACSPEEIQERIDASKAGTCTAGKTLGSGYPDFLVYECEFEAGGKQYTCVFVTTVGGGSESDSGMYNDCTKSDVSNGRQKP